MTMDIARITSKGQMTIPKRIRDAAHLTSGDVLVLDVEDGRVTMRKLQTGEDSYLKGVQETLQEWNSPEDNDAWSDL